jgi:hypothetical protein
MRGEQDRLDPVAGAEVEGTLSLAANRQVGEGDGRAVHARHVVSVGFSRARMIGRDQQLVVRNDPRRAVNDFAVVYEKAGFCEQRL